jgi:hypothetical protein
MWKTVITEIRNRAGGIKVFMVLLALFGDSPRVESKPIIRGTATIGYV